MWIPDANVSRLHTDILTLINYYRVLASGMDVVLFAPIRLSHRGNDDIMVYPNVGVIIRRLGPRMICTRNNEHQVYEGPPNFVLEIESKHGFTDIERSSDSTRRWACRKPCSSGTKSRQPGISFKLESTTSLVRNLLVLFRAEPCRASRSISKNSRRGNGSI